MYLVKIAWMYVVVMMAAAEASDSNGSLLGAFLTLLLYGLLPLSIVTYLLNTPARRRALRALQQAPAGTKETPGSEESARPPDPDQSRHAAGEPISPVRKEP